MNNTRREYGIDILRILSMMMVLVLHVFSNGKVLKHLVFGSTNYYVGWFFEALCFCAVDIFAIMTGYLMVDKKIEYWKFIPRWLQAWVISISITVFYKVFVGGRVTAEEWMMSLFPLTYSQWKYLTEYFIVVLFMPGINLAIKHMSRQQQLSVLMIIFCLSLWTTLCFDDPINLLNGYSVAWIVLLYIVGALIKETNLNKRVSQRQAICIYFICVILTYVSKIMEVFLMEHLLD